MAAIAERYDARTDGRQLSKEMNVAYREIDWLAEIMEESFVPVERQMDQLNTYIQQTPLGEADKEALARWAQARVCEGARRIARIGSRDGHFMVQQPRRVA